MVVVVVVDVGGVEMEAISSKYMFELSDCVEWEWNEMNQSNHCK